jgi:hypothetical protein
MAPEWTREGALMKAHRAEVDGQLARELAAAMLGEEGLTASGPDRRARRTGARA